MRTVYHYSEGEGIPISIRNHSEMKCSELNWKEPKEGEEDLTRKKLNDGKSRFSESVHGGRYYLRRAYRGAWNGKELSKKEE